MYACLHGHTYPSTYPPAAMHVTPLLAQHRLLHALQAMGFKLVAYPLSLLGVSIRAMEQALQVRCALGGPRVKRCRVLATRSLAVYL